MYGGGGDVELSGRQILMIVLGLVIFIGFGLGHIYAKEPPARDPEGSRRVVIACRVVGGLAALWFVKLGIDAVRDRRRGVVRGPAKVGGWFDVCLGLAATAGGVAGSALSYANAASGGEWTLYVGLIVWGVLQTSWGCDKLRSKTGSRSNP
jgi:hypothetical protein